MFQLKNFCYCCDLRRGCIVYAWLQMMIVVVIATKVTWFHDLFSQAFMFHSSAFLFTSLQLSIIKSLQIIKGVSSAALIWGIVKNNHMFYQPWLFINGLETSVLTLVTGATFIIGCMEPFFFYFLPVFALLSAFGWYIWACVFVVYKRDMKPNIIGFDSHYENFNMNNINASV